MTLVVKQKTGEGDTMYEKLYYLERIKRNIRGTKIDGDLPEC